jgi:hypothetical protein
MMATCCSIPAIGWMKRDIVKLEGDLLIYGGQVESQRRTLEYTRRQRDSIAAELRKARAWIAKNGKKRKGRK